MIIWKVTPFEHVLGFCWGFVERDGLWTEKVQVQWNLIVSAARWYFVWDAPVFTYNHGIKKKNQSHLV